MEYATIDNEQDYTVFRFGDHTIRFKAPFSLEHYTSVKEWDHGYLVVMAKYTHNNQDDADAFLKPIKEVRIYHA